MFSCRLSRCSVATAKAPQTLNSADDLYTVNEKRRVNNANPAAYCAYLVYIGVSDLCRFRCHPVVRCHITLADDDEHLRTIHNGRKSLLLRY